MLVPVFRDPRGKLCLILVRRASGGIHGGQLAFPGGRRDPMDRSHRETALRETREEIGLTPDRVVILEHLPPVETVTTSIRVFPFLARVKRPRAWTPCEREIAEILEVPLSDLARPAARGRTLMSFPTWPGPREVPYILVGRYRLWGLTYRLLEPLLPRLMAGEWEI